MSATFSSKFTCGILLLAGLWQLGYSSAVIASPTTGTNYPNSSGGLGLNPTMILDLINALSNSGSINPTQVDLSPEIAEIRGRISRLYFLLARQYSLQNQLPAACTALEKAYLYELESYLSKRLTPQPDSNDCHASELQRMSQITGSPTALIYVTTSKGGIETITIPPNNASANLFSKQRLATKSLTKGLGIPIAQSTNNTGIPFHRLNSKATTEDIDRVIINFRINLQDSESDDFLPQAQQLYDWVIRPIEADLQKSGTKTIVFVMNGNLRVVPPAAFHDGDRYLIEKYAVTSIPAWQLTNKTKFDRQLLPQILAMGLSESTANWSPLPAAALEVETISSKILKGSTFLNHAFTIANLRSQISSQKFGIIHLATHAKFMQRSPKDSFIQFWDDQLHLSDIAQMKISTDLLTLSACETAVGEDLGLAGLAVDSGASSVLASLWQVSDLGTAPLMMRFYRGLPKAATKAIALQEAQLAFLRGEVTISNQQIYGIQGLSAIAFPVGSSTVNLKHPFYWSAFTLVGNWY